MPFYTNPEACFADLKRTLEKHLGKEAGNEIAGAIRTYVEEVATDLKQSGRD